MFSPCLLLLFATSCVGRTLYYTTLPVNDWEKEALLLGNGNLGVAFFGNVRSDRWVLNIDSLWTGGQFEHSAYRGGNPTSPLTAELASIRQSIMTAGGPGTASTGPMQTRIDAYGSYSFLGYMDVNYNIQPAGATGYSRWLDLTTGLGGSNFTLGTQTFTRTYFCSYPKNVCVYRVVVDSGFLPSMSVSLIDPGRTPAPTLTCNATSGIIGMRGKAENTGGSMIFDSQVTLQMADLAGCSCTNGTLNTPGNKHTEFVAIFAGDTNYDSSKGNAASGYSFRGVDPGTVVPGVLSRAKAMTYAQLKSGHVADHQSLYGKFWFTVGDPKGSAAKSLDTVVNTYDINTGDPYLEALLFDYSRYLVVAATRGTSLSPNLQGRWSNKLSGNWGVDYHANINMQMNMWSSEGTALVHQADQVFKYISDTWVPRGTETAQLLYGARGWVTHNEMNAMGYTSMKQGKSQWANFPVASNWMMQHMWDHYDYTRDTTWYRTKAYPLMKGVALFWLDNLQPDTYFNDGTLVAVPCDSPEHTPNNSGLSTFGCAIFQQLIYETFSNILKGWSVSGDTDTAFRDAVAAALGKLDPGVSIGKWGQIKEWKIDWDKQGDTHRHLSQLYGFFPGYSISSVYRNNTAVMTAVSTLLTSRGTGKGADANAGWEKVWRGACWAWLLNPTKAYYELKFTISENISPNLMSMYSGKSPPFQIDANYGWGGATLAMLVKDTDYKVAEWDSVQRTIVLGPGIPSAWGPGAVNGVRLRGQAVIDFTWDAAGVVKTVHVVNAGVGSRKYVNIAGATVTPS